MIFSLLSIAILRPSELEAIIFSNKQSRYFSATSLIKYQIAFHIITAISLTLLASFFSVIIFIFLSKLLTSSDIQVNFTDILISTLLGFWASHYTKYNFYEAIRDHNPPHFSLRFINKFSKTMPSILIGGIIGIATNQLYNLIQYGYNKVSLSSAIIMLSAILYYYRYFYSLIFYIEFINKNNIPSESLQKSCLYWDEAILTKLPLLKEWLYEVFKEDEGKWLDQILFIIKKRPFQRAIAYESIMEATIHKINKGQSINDIYIIINRLPITFLESENLSYNLQSLKRQLKEVALLIEDYQSRQTHIGKKKIIQELINLIEESHLKAIISSSNKTSRWLKIFQDEQKKIQEGFLVNELENPYMAGNPLQIRDNHLFVGRHDILLAIETYILNAEQRPSLLLYGRRRTGKSSTLLNLPHSRFEPVYIDCQDAKWHESDQAFCYNLANDIFNRLFQSDSVKNLPQPKIEQYEKNAFTQLDQFLNHAQKLTEERSKRILLAFDEYEELENAIINGDISEKVLGKLRNLIQHSKPIVVLVSGSHRFEELTRLNWANYLINTRTLELSYLEQEPARELLTKPVPELHYEDAVVDDIIRVTHCQPYLLQAVASELINYLNSKQQTTATPDDLNTALDKTLVSASAYFSDTWRKDNSPEEQQVMRALANGNADSLPTDASLQPAIQSLIRKEIVERSNGGYRLAVELFARWIVKNQV